MTDRQFGTAPADAAHALDPDLDLGAPEASDLDELRAELTAKVADVTEPYEVPGRPRYSAAFATDFTSRQLDGWRRKAKDKSFVDGVNGVKFASILLGATCRAIYRDGKPLELGDDGKPATFQSRELMEILGTDGVAATVVAFYGREAHVDAMARRLMAEAGWGDEVDAADPTT